MTRTEGTENAKERLWGLGTAVLRMTPRNGVGKHGTPWRWVHLRYSSLETRSVPHAAVLRELYCPTIPAATKATLSCTIAGRAQPIMRSALRLQLRARRRRLRHARPHHQSPRRGHQCPRRGHSPTAAPMCIPSLHLRAIRFMYQRRCHRLQRRVLRIKIQPARLVSRRIRSRSRLHTNTHSWTLLCERYSRPKRRPCRFIRASPALVHMLPSHNK